LKYFEGLLKEYGFMRVHGSSIINLDHIDEYFRGTQGKAGHVLMSNGQEVSVSRNKRVDLLEKFSLGQG
jgi:two-component system, LytTR family, response regulator